MPRIALIRSRPRQVVLACILVLGGCYSPDRPGWGERICWPIQGDRVLESARNAVLDRRTWVPAAGAAVFYCLGWDQRVSDWATDHMPIFGSTQAALDASDQLQDLLAAEAILTALASPSGSDPQTWAFAKAKGLAVEGGALVANRVATGLLKGLSDRQRPNLADHRSLPSGHASMASACATLAGRNIASIESVPEDLRWVLSMADLSICGLVGWARVEGKAHYPSDVLAGMALGHFVAALIHDSLMADNGTVTLVARPCAGGVILGLGARF